MSPKLVIPFGRQSSSTSNISFFLTVKIPKHEVHLGQPLFPNNSLTLLRRGQGLFLVSGTPQATMIWRQDLAVGMQIAHAYWPQCLKNN